MLSAVSIATCSASFRRVSSAYSAISTATMLFQVLQLVTGRLADEEHPVGRCASMSDVVGDLWWRDEDSQYIRHRSDRYPGATNIEPGWTLEAAADSRRIVYDPDPKSRTGAIRIIGYSPSAGFVVTVIATGGGCAGVTAWQSSGGSACRAAGIRRGRG